MRLHLLCAQSQQAERDAGGAAATPRVSQSLGTKRELYAHRTDSSAAKCCADAVGKADLAFEKAATLHGSQSVELWLSWVQFKRQQGKPVGTLVQQAVARLDGALADTFVQSVQGSTSKEVLFMNT
jgi:hypothetical protein